MNSEENKQKEKNQLRRKGRRMNQKEKQEE
jgi:hypothetical protein